jgi:hypothetical protein
MTTSNGGLRNCRYCGITIYLHYDWDGFWRPYESWVAGTVEEAVWQLHDCPSQPMRFGTFGDGGRAA